MSELVIDEPTLCAALLCALIAWMLFKDLGKDTGDPL